MKSTSAESENRSGSLTASRKHCPKGWGPENQYKEKIAWIDGLISSDLSKSRLIVMKDGLNNL